MIVETVSPKVCQKYPVPKQFTVCRDCIILTLILQNGSRPGTIRNMTLREFKAGIASKHRNWYKNTCNKNATANCKVYDFTAIIIIVIIVMQEIPFFQK